MTKMNGQPRDIVNIGHMRRTHTHKRQNIKLYMSKLNGQSRNIVSIGHTMTQKHKIHS